MTVSRERVLDAAANWVWVPVDAVDATTTEYRMTLYRDLASVAWSTTERPVEDLADEIVRRAREAGSPRLRWWVTDRTTPAQTATVLERLGFQLAETLDVLALDLTSFEPEGLRLPKDVTVRLAEDEASLRLAGDLGAEVFDEPPPSAAQLADSLRSVQAARASGTWRFRQYVAHLGDRPVGTGGATLDDDVLRLWGGAVLPDARGRGVYRSMLATRCADGVAAGARVALVKGRVKTSGPILRRAGFDSVGQERGYDLPLR